jgi:hypothetical protein
MRWLKHTTVALLLMVAAGVALATAFSNHDADYGRASLPQGGAVKLPKGQVKIFYEQGGQDAVDTSQLSSPITLQIVPATGGAPLKTSATAEGTSDLGLQRSEDLGSLGSVADIDVPAAGEYIVSGSAGQSATSLTFGTTAGQALVNKWHLLAALVGAALLISLIPVPRRRGAGDQAESSWSSDPRSPYAGTRDRAPYAG